MALINHRTHEIHFKIVYYGPGLCGKTTNLRALHDRLPPERRGKMISIATDHERTLFFDFLPIDLGHVNGFLTRFHLYTVPGQVYYKLSRRAVLQGVDGLVFVADSHPAREAANRESLADLNEHLRTLGVTGPALARIPWVFQWNKRDSAVAVPIERLRNALNPHGWPEFEAIASEGKGVSETLRSACKSVLARLAGGPPAAASQGTGSAASTAGVGTGLPGVAAGAAVSAGSAAPHAPVASPAGAAGTRLAPPAIATPASMPPPAIASAAVSPPAITSATAPPPLPSTLPPMLSPALPATSGGTAPLALASTDPGTPPRP